MEYFETVIIGGGPAGTAAGISLLKKGRQCCIVDKRRFPRDKTCGGGLTQKTMELLAELNLSVNLESFYVNKTNRFSIRNKNRLVSAFECKHDIYLTNRTLFDYLLLEEFKKSGGIVFENECVEDVDSLKKVISTKNELLIQYKYLIFADGAKGISNKLVRRKNVGITVEADISADLFKFDNQTICIDFGLKNDGYGWVFPKNEYATVGIGCSYKKGENYLMEFKQYLSYYGVNKTDIPIKMKGATLPFWPNANDASCPKFNALLVGDAAGMVDALTGEGIYFALKSGMLAAEAITGEENVLETYHASCRKIYEIIEKSQKVGTTFYKYKRIFMFFAKNKEKQLAHFCDKELAHYAYGYTYNIRKKFFSFLTKKALLIMMLCVLPLWTNAQTNDVYNLDSIVTKNADGVYMYKTEYKYDDKGTQTLLTSYTWDEEAKTLVKNTKCEYQYGPNNRYTLDVWYYWEKNTGVWIENEKYENQYNANGEQTSFAHYIWDKDTGVWVENYKYEYQYNANNNLLSYNYYHWDSDARIWLTVIKEEYQYDINNNCVLITTYDWDRDSGQWTENCKYEYEYNNNNACTIETWYYWDKNFDDWIRSYKYEFEYDTNNNQTMYAFYYWDGHVSGTWVVRSKNEFEYGDNNNEISYYMYSIWDNDTKTWIKYSKYEYEYDDNGYCISEITHVWDENTWTLNSQTQYHYSITSLTGLLHGKQLNVEIYPNPSTGLLNVEMHHLPAGQTADILLYNLSGKLIASFKAISNFATIDISGEAAGTYLMKIVTGETAFGGNQYQTEWKIIKK